MIGNFHGTGPCLQSEVAQRTKLQSLHLPGLRRYQDNLKLCLFTMSAYLPCLNLGTNLQIQIMASYYHDHVFFPKNRVLEEDA